MESRSNNIPEIIWHYTSIDTLVKICTTRTIRATHYAFMNDVDEIKTGAQEMLVRLDNQLYEEQCQATVDYMRNVLKAVLNGTDLNRFYIISFSRTADSLSQWRGYTPSHGGVAVGFSASELFKAIKKNPNDENVLLFPCVYGPPDVGFVKLKIRLVAGNASKQFGVTDNQLLYEPMCVIKHPCFKEESEIRIIVIRTNDNIGFENGKPFISLEISESAFPEIIKTVMISPHGDVEKNERYVRFLSHALGEQYDKNSAEDGLMFSVERSSLPFRS